MPYNVSTPAAGSRWARNRRRGAITLEWILLVTVIIIGTVGAVAAVRNELVTEYVEILETICKFEHRTMVLDAEIIDRIAHMFFTEADVKFASLDHKGANKGGGVGVRGSIGGQPPKPANPVETPAPAPAATAPAESRSVSGAWTTAAQQGAG